MHPSVKYLVLPYLPLPQDLIHLVLRYVDEPQWEDPLLDQMRRYLLCRLPHPLIHAVFSIGMVSYHEYTDFCTFWTVNNRHQREQIGIAPGKSCAGHYLPHLSNTIIAILIYAHNPSGQMKRLFDLYVDMTTMRMFTYNGGYVVNRLDEAIFSRVKNVCWNLIRHDPSIPGNRGDHTLAEFLDLSPLQELSIRPLFFQSVHQILVLILTMLRAFTPGNVSSTP